MRPGAAERLPFPDGSFDIALAQLVVHFMTDPVSGLREMARSPAGGLVAACVWDHAGGGAPLATFWRAVHDIDPHARDEAELAVPGKVTWRNCARRPAWTTSNRFADRPHPVHHVH